MERCGWDVKFEEEDNFIQKRRGDVTRGFTQEARLPQQPQHIQVLSISFKLHSPICVSPTPHQEKAQRIRDEANRLATELDSARAELQEASKAAVERVGQEKAAAEAAARALEDRYCNGCHGVSKTKDRPCFGLVWGN